MHFVLRKCFPDGFSELPASDRLSFPYIAVYGSRPLCSGVEGYRSSGAAEVNTVCNNAHLEKERHTNFGFADMNG